jgi:hypothetical protein
MNNSKLMRSLILLMLIGVVAPRAFAQDYRWQQRADYVLDAKLDVTTHKVTGSEKLTYTNNSKDTLRSVFFHLYFNAFQPGSMMDVRSRTIPDPDKRVGDRISKLKDDEIGYQHIQSLKQDGKDLSFHIDGTVMEVTLAKPVLPNTKTIFELKFESQVPVQIRRSGRNSREGISYSMTQWYPKIAEYDHQGWHAYPYIAREFHSVFGDYDVKLTLDPSYIVGGTGKLVNADKVGHGYEKSGATVTRPKGDLTWNFVAKNVIDFAWAADPDYSHDRLQVPNGPELHFIYQTKLADTWKKMEEFAVKHFEFMNKTFGKYPYDTYTVIQGGDGGMEYPMCTLILGEGSLDGLIGLMAHEVAHSWFQGVLASNEALYAWMDEGFADFAEHEFESSVNNVKPDHAGNYGGYFALVKSGLQEPISQASDHFNTNRAYSVGSYSMGSIFLHQLKYVIGEDVFYKGMLRYYNTWKLRHPEPNDFIRVMEKESGLQLKWYLQYWTNTTKRIDYAVRNLVESDARTLVTLERIGELPMPIDLVVTLKDGSKEMIYIPLSEMRGNKPVEDKDVDRTDLTAWPWVNPTYTVSINHKSSEIATIEIDPSLRMADIDRKNNKLDLTQAVKAFESSTR